jgi:two-component sensor histidine kinase
MNQRSIDEDSALWIACRIYGIDFSSAFNEDFEERSPTIGASFLNAGNISKAQQLLPSLTGEKRLQLLSELGLWYLHKPRTLKTDLDEAYGYFQEALQLSGTEQHRNWRLECLHNLGEWHFQSSRFSEGEKIFKQLIKASESEGNSSMLIRAYLRMGRSVLQNDSAKRFYFDKALRMCQQSHYKEKEIEVLWNIAFSFLANDYNISETIFRQIFDKQQAIGFKHSLYAQYSLSYVKLLQSDNFAALQYADAALANVEWANATPLLSSFLTRKGSVYVAFGRNEEALNLFQKALAIRTSETRLFWYKTFFFTTYLLLQMGRVEETLKLIKTITSEYPPLTSWEKIQVATYQGLCYDKLGKPQLVDQHYTTLLDILNNEPGADPYKELTQIFPPIIDFYIKHENLRKARMFLKNFYRSLPKDTTGVPTSHYDYSTLHSILYKMDSIAGNYKSALEHYRQYQTYKDLEKALDQRKQFEELNLKYAADKKDQNIKLLTERNKVQQATLKQNNLFQNLILGGSALLLVILSLVYNQYRIKQRSSIVIEKKNTALQHMVLEKEWLLKEVHHRVKNNLQTVVSLLELQAENLDNEALSAIHNGQNRIYTISLIHQKLYQTDNVASINMKDYLLELTQHLRDVYNVGRSIDFDIHIAPLELDVSQAIPIGLIVNEAVTNSIKHGFAKATLKISILLQRHAMGHLELVTSDNGPGLPAGFEYGQSSGLGFKLIRALAEDLDGELDIESDSGTVIKVQFSSSAPLYVNNDPSGQLKTQPT